MPAACRVTSSQVVVVFATTCVFQTSLAGARLGAQQTDGSACSQSGPIRIHYVGWRLPTVLKVHEDKVASILARNWRMIN